MVLEPSCASLTKSINIIDTQLSNLRLLVLDLIYSTPKTAKRTVRLKNLKKSWIIHRSFMAYVKHLSKLHATSSTPEHLVQSSMLHLKSSHPLSQDACPRDLFHGFTNRFHRGIGENVDSRSIGLFLSTRETERHIRSRSVLSERYSAKSQNLTSSKDLFCSFVTTDHLLGKNTNTSPPSGEKQELCGRFASLFYEKKLLCSGRL